MATVERFALDMYVDTTAGHGQVAGSAAKAAASAAASAGEIVGEDEGVENPAKVLLQEEKKKWKIPKLVPRGYEIPIAVVTTNTEPAKGKFRRLGLDVVVNATWLAMKWAVESEDSCRRGSLHSDPRLAFRLHPVRRDRDDSGGKYHEAHHQYACGDRASA